LERWATDATDGGSRYLERPDKLRIDPASIEQRSMRPTFETGRLRVFHVPLLLYPEGFAPRTFDEALNVFPRHLFVAFRKDMGSLSPRVAATAVVFRFPSGDSPEKGMTPMVDWVEVSTECRRKGFGTELVDGIERYTGWTMDLVDSEPALRAAIEAARKRRRDEQGNGGTPSRNDMKSAGGT